MRVIIIIFLMKWPRNMIEAKNKWNFRTTIFIFFVQGSFYINEHERFLKSRVKDSRQPKVRIQVEQRNESHWKWRQNDWITIERWVSSQSFFRSFDARDFFVPPGKVDRCFTHVKNKGGKMTIIDISAPHEDCSSLITNLPSTAAASTHKEIRELDTQMMRKWSLKMTSLFILMSWRHRGFPLCLGTLIPRLWRAIRLSPGDSDETVSSDKIVKTVDRLTSAFVRPRRRVTSLASVANVHRGLRTSMAQRLSPRGSTSSSLLRAPVPERI